MPTRQLTDIGNAERLADRHGDALRFVPAWKRWVAWDGTRWQRDEANRSRTLAHETVRHILEEALAAETSNERADLSKWAAASESDQGVRAMLNCATGIPALIAEPSRFDADPWLLNVENGTINLRTGNLRAHRREDLLTKRAGVRFDREARCPMWTAFLDTIMLGRADLVAFLQRAIGYALTGDVREQCFFFAYGGGENGKSTFLETVSGLLGEYALTADFSTFAQRKYDAGPRNDIAKLVGARLVTAIEAGEGHRLAEGLVKTLTGGDRVSARRLYEEPFEFWPTCKLFFASNHKPRIAGTDHGIWRRVRLIPFEYGVPPEAKDEELKAKLASEGPGILNWMLDGLEAWLERGHLEAPEPVRLATEEYRAESDVVGQFLDDRCDVSPGHSVAAGELYADFRVWCDAAGLHRMTAQRFGRELTERGIGFVRGSDKARTKARTGIRLNPDRQRFGPIRTDSGPIPESPPTRAREGDSGNGGRSVRNGPEDDQGELGAGGKVA
jgi:putative DNA primase/helicase